MTDLSLTIAPKSDQLNSDDLLGGPRTIEITSVELTGVAEQPVSINFEGDDGRPYKPCKSMRRVLVRVWGPDGNAYAGRKMTLYRDDGVKYGGMEVGGIRISHMSDITRPITMALTATRANKKPYTVKPLTDEPATTSDYSPDARVDAKIRELKEKFEDIQSLQDHQAFASAPETSQTIEWLKKNRTARYNKELLPAIKASFERNMPKREDAAEPPPEDAFEEAVSIADGSSP